MKTSYFTFGQSHTHRVPQGTIDCNTVIKITAPDPRARMFELFGNKWAFEYDEANPLKSQYYNKSLTYHDHTYHTNPR